MWIASAKPLKHDDSEKLQIEAKISKSSGERYEAFELNTAYENSSESTKIKTKQTEINKEIKQILGKFNNSIISSTPERKFSWRIGGISVDGALSCSR